MALSTPRKADLSRAGDRKLAALAAERNESAFEAIFERHYRGLLSLCRHLLGSPEEAEDAVQHTFAAAYRQLVERGPPEHLRAWLYATARNRCLDVLRTRRDLPEEPPPASTSGLSEEVERRSDLRELLDDMRRLPEDQRAALVMSEVEALGHAEVAEALGCPRDKVRALVYQARSSLSGWREARALPCREVQQELAIARGGALRRGHLRRHLKVCPECAAFREEVDRQRRRVALVLPVLPSLGFKERVLDAAWGAQIAGGGAAGGGAAVGGGGTAAGGALAGSLASTAIKIGAAMLVLGGGVATFAGEPGGQPARTTPSSAAASERSSANAPRLGAASPEADPLSTSKQLREQTAATLLDTLDADQLAQGTPALPKALDADQLAQGTPALPKAPELAPPSVEVAPGGASAPDVAPAPAQPEVPSVDRVSPPDPSAELDVDVDPPTALP
jgi:RNA polymerase sigma factor (sigma-70 family)